MRTRLFILLLLSTSILIKPVYTAPGSGLPDPECPVESSVLTGTVRDSMNAEPIGFVNILLQELNRSITTDAKGRFVLSDLRCGSFTARTFRIGYKNITFPVTLVHKDTTQLDIVLEQTPLMFQDVLVESQRSSNEELASTPIMLSDKKLHANLGKTIAETVDYEPGVSQQTMGPAPARPVLRGLGGARLLMLEDANTTGDLSATSADHAVAIEPLTTERIEVVRGPKALTYGSNTLGGVINVVRGFIPTTGVKVPTGSFTLNGETVNSGNAVGGDISLPVGPLTVRLDGSTRRAESIQTPAGTLSNTGIHTKNASAGAALIRKWGRVGFAAGDYESSYGIPPDPYGGHPKGVDINLERRHTETLLEWFPHQQRIKSVNIIHTWSRYYHEEIEASGDLGMNFGAINHNLRIETTLGSCGKFENSKIGLKSSYRDYATGGLTFTPAVQEYNHEFYFYQQANLGPFIQNGAVRYNFKSIKPDTLYESRQVGTVRERQFQGVAASVSLQYDYNNWLLGSTVTRTFMPPGVEELFSEGPHLAAYAYEVGNAALNAETGLGTELFIKKNQRDHSLYFAVYQNYIDNYLIPVNTGTKSWRRADLYVYRYLGEAVMMRGTELSGSWLLSRYFSLSGTLSYVWGEISSQHTPIPRTPPLEGRLALNYRKGSFSAGINLRAADAQTRTGEFETTTDGYTVLDLSAQYLIAAAGFMHSISLSVNNATDTSYRKHLNRVKDVMPEPGRNVRLLYKVFY